MAFNYENNTIINISAPTAAGSTSISLDPVKATLIPDGLQNTIATLEEPDATTGSILKREGILITNKAGNILTVVRRYQQMPLTDTATIQQQISYPFNPANGARIGLYWTKAHGDAIDEQLEPGSSSGLVHKTTDETIDDIKTFTSLPQQFAYSAPTLDNELAPKKYIDDKIATSIPVDSLFGTGSEGDVSISAGITTEAVPNTGILIKEYENLDITGGTLNFSGGQDDGNIIIIKVRDTLTMSSGLIDVSLMGGIGGIGPELSFGGAVIAGSGQSLGINNPDVANNGVNGVLNAAIPGTLGGSGINGLFTFGNNAISVFAGGGGGYGGAGRGGAFNKGGNGGRGAGGLIILAKNLNFTGGTIRSNGEDGFMGLTTSRGGAGGGGGGASGSISIVSDNIISNTGTIELVGGKGADGDNSLATGVNDAGGAGGAGGEGQTGGGNGGGSEDNSDGEPGTSALNSINGIGGLLGAGGLGISQGGAFDAGGGGGGGGGGAGEFFIEEI